MADPIRDRLFQLFTSYGKQNEIGPGLPIRQTIFRHHGGRSFLESTEPGMTSFRLTLPIIIREDEATAN